MRTFNQILGDIIEELRSARAKFPNWPRDPIHAATVLAEECGELQKAVLQATYEDGKIEQVEKEAIQTAAMAIRFLQNLGRYKYAKAKEFKDA